MKRAAANMMLFYILDHLCLKIIVAMPQKCQKLGINKKYDLQSISKNGGLITRQLIRKSNVLRLRIKNILYIRIVTSWNELILLGGNGHNTVFKLSSLWSE